MIGINIGCGWGNQIHSTSFRLGTARLWYHTFKVYPHLTSRLTQTHTAANSHGSQPLQLLSLALRETQLSFFPFSRKLPQMPSC